jgi:hypothetical protein
MALASAATSMTPAPAAASQARAWRCGKQGKRKEQACGLLRSCSSCTSSSWRTARKGRAPYSSARLTTTGQCCGSCRVWAARRESAHQAPPAHLPLPLAPATAWTRRCAGTRMCAHRRSAARSLQPQEGSSDARSQRSRCAAASLHQSAGLSMTQVMSCTTTALTCAL